MPKKLARTFGQDLMRGEHVVGQTRTRRAADRRSNLTGAPKTPAWAQGIIGTEHMATGTSIFDPVVCELAYRWFCPPTGAVLDPFAGGSVRGLVASRLGRRYVGIDLRPEQIKANQAQADRICEEPKPVWIEGDAQDIRTLCGDLTFDFLFTCPPYADLEIYSDHPRDLSTMPFETFLAAYQAIIVASVALLRPNRFACLVIGDVRDGNGCYRLLPWRTMAFFEAAGARLWNEAVLVTALGSLPIRVGKQFEGSRKLGKTHQNILVFCKGDPKAATEAIGPVEFEIPNIPESADDEH